MSGYYDEYNNGGGWSTDAQGYHEMSRRIDQQEAAREIQRERAAKKQRKEMQARVARGEHPYSPETISFLQSLGVHIAGWIKGKA